MINDKLNLDHLEALEKAANGLHACLTGECHICGHFESATAEVGPELLRRARLLGEAVKILKRWANDAKFDNHHICNEYPPDACGACESTDALLARIDAEVGL